MDHVIEPLEACSEPRVLSFLLGPGEDLGSIFPSIRELKSCYCPKNSILVTVSSCDMSPRSEVAWEEWEKKNLLPWQELIARPAVKLH
jgi:hypothetical protein